jgi:hypothetical protein
MNKKRIKIPKHVELSILYKNAWTCCRCRSKQNIQIHHIDENPSNNNDTNLSVLCSKCHDEAHTKHTLSRNLTPAIISDLKLKWEKEIAESVIHSITHKYDESGMALWTYINLERLPQVLKVFGLQYNKRELNILHRSGITDKNGIPNLSPNSSKKNEELLETIYDRMDWSASQRFHYMCINAVDSIIENRPVIYLNTIWSRREIKSLLEPGTLCYCIRPFYFKPLERCGQKEDRLVYTRSKCIELQLRVNSWYMYGNSSLYDSFSGHRVAALLFIVKEIKIDNKMLFIHGTPIALGINFSRIHNNFPYTFKDSHLSRVAH